MLTLGLLSVEGLVGCGRPLASPIAWRFSHTGHVYLSSLLSEHPLYQQYVRLGQEIATLRQPIAFATPPPVFLELGELFLPAPQPPVFPLEQFELRREEWRLTLLPTETASLAALDPDLRAELRWARRQATELAATQLQSVRSAQEAKVAEGRAEAVRTRQEALNNAGLDNSLPEREAQEAADRERRRLWAEIEQEQKAAQAAANEVVAAARSRIEESLQAQISAAEAEAWRRMKSRTEIFAKSGSETRTRMSNAMVPPEPPAFASGLSWRPRGGGNAPDVIAGDIPALLEREQRLRQAQAESLTQRRAELARQIEQGVELAVRRVAAIRGLRVTIPPLEPAEGRDVTELLRPALREMYQP